MGHCGCSAEGSSRVYSWNDTTVPPEDKEFVFDIGLQSDQHIPGTRALFLFNRATCSTGYAITLTGAKKLVKFFKDADSNLDIQLSALCSKFASIICVGVWPQIFTNAKSASNIDHTGAGDVVPGKEQEDMELPPPGPAIQFSAHRNAKLALEGWDQSAWKAEWETMWAPGEYEEEGRPVLEGDGKWVLMPLNRTEGFAMGGGR